MRAAYLRTDRLSALRTGSVVATFALFAACGAGGPAQSAPRVLRSPPAAPRIASAMATASHATTLARRSADRVAVSEASLSIGTASAGHLARGVELPVEGEHHSVIDRLRAFGARWGTAELVTVIQRAAAYVHQTEGGAPLRVAELSREGGGNIRSHRSHNSGRDVDLAFYVLDAETGESVPAPRQVRFNGRGESRATGLRFDVARNWRLVEGLLSQDIAVVQWLFVSEKLKALMLAHAAEVGADPETIRRAGEVLHQPSTASPHTNHFHMRILCAPDDAAEGCVDTGPTRT